MSNAPCVALAPAAGHPRGKWASFRVRVSTFACRHLTGAKLPFRAATVRERSSRSEASLCRRNRDAALWIETKEKTNV